MGRLINKYFCMLRAKQIKMAREELKVVPVKAGMTEKESEISELLVKAHNLFAEIESTHPQESFDWSEGIRKLQYVLGMRTLRRDYPKYYSSVKSK
jgi:hypothetical protein